MNAQNPDSGDDKPDANPPDASAAAPGSESVRWPGLIRSLDTVRNGVTRVLAFVCIVLFTWLVVVVVWQVFTRQVLHDSAPWTAEAATTSLVIFAITAIAYVYSERGHIAVEMFVQKLPQSGQRIMGVIIELIVIFFTVFVFIWGGARVAMGAWGQSMSILPVTVGQLYLVLPIAGVLIVFYSLTFIVGIIAGVEKPMPEFDENAEAI